MSVSIIIPTLNEKRNIKYIFNYLKYLNFQNELIFVDDNSDDGTVQEIKKFKKKNTIIIQRREKRDLSQSILKGVNRSKYKNILVMDADLQHSFRNLNIIYRKFINTNFDIIIGSRFSKNKTTNYNSNRIFLSKILVFLINLLFTKITSDPLSGFFICKKKIITNYSKHFYKKGYKLLFDIIYNGKKNLKTSDLYIIFSSRKYGKSKLNLKIFFIFMFQMLFTLKRKFFLKAMYNK
jgi:dolichol-phosphate mannosyltransferase